MIFPGTPGGGFLFHHSQNIRPVERQPATIDARRMVFATLIRVSDQWSRVSVSDLERQQLRPLRRELGIDPDPTDERKEVRRRKKERSVTQAAARSYRRFRT